MSTNLVPVRIALLGPPDVEVAGAPLRVDTRKAVAVLAVAALAPGRVRRDHLAALLWPEADEERARAALRRTLSALNAGLGGLGLVVSREHVELDPKTADADVREFEALAAEAAGHDHGPSEACAGCAPALERAAALYRDDFLSGFVLRDTPDFDDWAIAEAERLRRTLSGVLERLTEHHFAAKRWAVAIEYGHRRLALDPLNESAHRSLMRLYAASGDRGAALRQYRNCVAVLERELGVAPLEETRAVAEQLTADIPAPPRSPATPSAPAEPLPLTGRDEELTRLKAECMPGRVVAVTGEAGIGKTRLVYDFVAQHGGPIVTAHAYADSTGVPYSLVADALRAAAAAGALRSVAASDLAEAARLVPDLRGERPTPGPGSEARLVHGVSRALEGVAPEGILVLEDLHWADAASIGVVASLARRAPRSGLCLIVTWRPEDLEGTVLPDGAVRIELGRLAESDVGSLARAAGVPAGLVQRLYHETEGVPFFVDAYVRSVTASGWDVPAGVRAMIRARIGGLSETARQVVTAAAVIGRSFELETVLRTSGRSEEETVAALEELAGARIITEATHSPDGYDFTHDKLRELAYEEAGLARRRLLHRRVAEALEASGRHKAAGRRAEIASHYRLAGRDDAAALAFREAGDEARSLFANREAAAHYEAALALGHPDAPSLHEALGDLRTLSGAYEEALVAYESAAAGSAGPESLSRLEHKIGAVHVRRGAWDAADDHLQAALEGSVAAAERARILVDRSVAARGAGRLELAVDIARQALALAEEAGDRRALAQVHNLLAMLHRAHGRLDEARTAVRTSLTMAEKLGDPAARAAALNNAALVESAAGEHALALEFLRTALGACALQGDRHREAALLNNIADVLRASGRTEDAVEHVKRSVAIFTEIGGGPGAEPEIWKLVDW